MRKCKHISAVIKEQDERTIDVFCPLCKLGWYGFKYPWRSTQGKLHKPPKWVTNLLPQPSREGKKAQ